MRRSRVVMVKGACSASLDTMQQDGYKVGHKDKFERSESMKVGKKPAFWVIVGISIALVLVLPAFIPLASIQQYINKIDVGDEVWWFSWSSMGDSGDSTRKCQAPLKVYMYDLPRFYNMGMIKKDDKNQELPWTSHVAPPWSARWEVNKQHSVEYWLMVYLLDSGLHKDELRAAVRVRDPEQADVFFVPFFASLSFNTYAHYMSGPGPEVDRQLQEHVLKFLYESKWWQASQGRDHVVVLHHPNSFRHYRDYLNASILVVSDFGRLKKTVARLRKDVVAPYAHVVHTYEQDSALDPFSARKTLLFFQGRIRRKDDGVVRAKLAELLVNKTEVHYVNSKPSSEALAEATKGMRSSRFCLHPAGDTPSSCRLFDAIVSHCVPVIISDKLELPFEDELNYSEFSVFISTEDAIKPDHVLDTVRNIKKEQWLQMWNRLKAIAHHFEYQYPPKKDDAVDMIFKQVQRKLPPIKLAVHRSQRLKIADWWQH